MNSVKPTCNICGGMVFGPGPAGRMSDTGKPPHCIHCGSLERHRANRGLFESLPIGALSWRRALQFSPDMALSPSWFCSFEVSVYDSENSLDLQKIDRPDECYDVVSISHVLEFVSDDHASFRELVRIISPHGLVHLVLSQPLTRAKCLDFVSATGIHQYFHLYGRDFEERFKMRERGLHLVIVRSKDPVTGVAEVVHLIFKSLAVAQALCSAIQASARHAPLFFDYPNVIETLSTAEAIDNDRIDQ